MKCIRNVNNDLELIAAVGILHTLLTNDALNNDALLGEVDDDGW